MNTHVIIADIHQDVSRIREGTNSQNQAVSDTRVHQYFSNHANYHLDSEQVSNFQY